MHKSMFSEDKLAFLTDNVREEIQIDNNTRLLYYAQDISMDKIKQIVPESLVQFLQWICGDNEEEETQVIWNCSINYIHSIKW